MLLRVCQQLFFFEKKKKARQFLPGHQRGADISSLSFYSFARIPLYQSRFIFCCSITTPQHYGIFVIFFVLNENTHNAIQNFMSRIQAAKAVLSILCQNTGPEPTPRGIWVEPPPEGVYLFKRYAYSCNTKCQKCLRWLGALKIVVFTKWLFLSVLEALLLYFLVREVSANSINI